MAQYDIPLLQEDASGVFSRVTLTPDGTRQEIHATLTSRVPALWTRGVAGLYTASNAVVTSITAANTWTKFTEFSTAVLDRGAVDADLANEHITVTATGIYLISYCLYFVPDAAAKNWLFGALADGVIIEGTRSLLTAPGTDTYHTAAMFPASLTANQVVTLQTQNNTDTVDLTITRASLSVVQIA